MTIEIRYKGNHNKCPACFCKDGKAVLDTEWIDGHWRRWQTYVVCGTKVCDAGACQDHAGVARHIHKKCSRCYATWLDCWKADRIPFWKLWRSER